MRSGLAILGLVIASPAWAAPGMIRLGYPSCAACHLLPQGGGLLTDYGKGIDRAQSLRGGEYVAPLESDARWLRHDVRLLMTAHALNDNRETTIRRQFLSWQLVYRNSTRLTGRNRLSYVAEMETTSPFAVNGPGTETPRFELSRILWEYSPAEGVQAAVGRDRLPTALGLPEGDELLRWTSEAGRPQFPIQAKLFLWSRRFEFTSYAFLPADNRRPEGSTNLGVGVLGGLILHDHRAVLGLSAQAAGGRGSGTTLGAYARVGIRGLGILAEYKLARDPQLDLTSRSTTHAGSAQLVFAPYEWLVSSVTTSYLGQSALVGRPGLHVRPEILLRATDRVSIMLAARDSFGVWPEHSGSAYSLRVALKTMR